MLGGSVRRCVGLVLQPLRRGLLADRTVDLVVQRVLRAAALPRCALPLALTLPLAAIGLLRRGSVGDLVLVGRAGNGLVRRVPGKPARYFLRETGRRILGLPGPPLMTVNPYTNRCAA